MTQPRYFIDERSGCIAVRDRTLTLPTEQCPGLHDYTPGVVWYRHGNWEGAWRIPDAILAEAKAEAERLNAALVGKYLTGCEFMVLGKSIIPDPRYIEGHPLFTAPWSVESYTNICDKMVWCVRSAEGHLIIQPGEHNQEWCEALARSRNSGTVQEDVAYQIAIKERGLVGAMEQVDRVRTHFTAELSRVMETNRILQNSIVVARNSRSTLNLPAWCNMDQTPTIHPSERPVVPPATPPMDGWRDGLVFIEAISAIRDAANASGPVERIAVELPVSYWRAVLAVLAVLEGHKANCAR